MYNNIGGKIKMLARVLAWIGIIACFIIGIVLISNDEDTVFIGFLTMILGSLVSWVSSFVLYGFGELVENSDILVSNKNKINGSSDERNDFQNHFYEKAASHKWRCPQCGNMISESICPICNNKTNQNTEVLKKWREQGLITEEEYQSKKSEMGQ